ncbi:sensor histidine kinase [Roseivirga seohaensis]|uniref:sensor histidine kinase n=1 Tax=Roseivirga seohaensis TaxID=1914963 RepID=UPI00069E5DE5|nr:ATP-binding protein [Roseivirga seohaensis]
MPHRLARFSAIKTIRGLALLTISFSLIVITGWVSQTPMILRIVEFGPTMKFNTAVCFLFSGLVLYTFTLKPSNRKIPLLLTLPIIIICGVTLIEYLFNIDVIATLLIEDNISSKSIGRMSVATMMCFLIFSLSFWLVSSKKQVNKQYGESVAIIIFITNLLSLIFFILRVPIEGRLKVMDTMAVHTSLSFIFLSISCSLVNPTIGFTSFLNSNRYGDKIIKSVLPVILILPILISSILSRLIDTAVLNIDLGLAVYSIVLILIGSVLITLYGKRINMILKQKVELEQSYNAVNQELLDYKYAIDQVMSVTIASPTQKILYVNDMFCETSGYSRTEILEEGYRLVQTDHHPPEFYEGMGKTVSMGQVWRGEILNKSKSGKTRWSHLTIIPFRNSEGEIYQHLTFEKDISLEKKAEELNRQYVHELKNKNKELQEFSYIASHDLQEPLRTITNYSGLLSKMYKSTLDKQGVEILQFIESAATRMQTLIHDILDYSRIGKEKEKTEIDTKSIVTQVIEDLSALINETNAKIKVGNLPTVHGAETEIRIVFQNLINNAIKFRKIDKTPSIEIGYQEEKTNHKFSIIDNGIGIAPQYKDKIFQIFQRLHKQSEYTGTGIGLAHCKKIIERHKGEIWFEPNDQQGTTFYFTIKKKQV